MKKAIAALAVLALTAGAAAAQEHHDRGERGDRVERGGGAPQGGGAPHGGPQGWGGPQGGQRFVGPQGGGAPQGQRFVGSQGGGAPQGGRDFNDHRFDRGDAQRFVQIQPQRGPQGFVDHRFDRGGERQGGRDFNDHRFDRDDARRESDHSFDRRGGAGWGRGDHRWDRDDRREWHEGHSWSDRGRYFEAFRVSPYYWPSGYGYRTWYPHEYLPFVFLNATWFLNNYYYYDLPAPPYGYRWVRYGPDALLVNVYSGEVVDVVYGVFYW